ncbi:MAG: heparinase II/III-family protein, partial [Desulfobulbaceae bacterium]|nr:heparinase II/III-family protein [Desulfobulbaceae bacterium]
AEQSFWYIGFISDALMHYLLLEDREQIPQDVKFRIEQLFDFINEMTLPNGFYPDFGDRDDGYVSRQHGDSGETRFLNLLRIGSHYFGRFDWLKETAQGESVFRGRDARESAEFVQPSVEQFVFSNTPHLKTYHDGGMTVMNQGKGRLLFRHAPLGLAPTYGHGHADALAVIFYWDNVPVLIDLGSGQYNGDQQVRNYFRSTIAHNTVEICGENQADMLGPFMWRKSYLTQCLEASSSPVMTAEAIHDGYLEKFSIQHCRKIVWREKNHIEIYDKFDGPGGVGMRGGFHLGEACLGVERKDNVIVGNFNKFDFLIAFPEHFVLQIYYGSDEPFLGWRSTIYGQWEPIHSVIFNSKITVDCQYRIDFRVMTHRPGRWLA